MNRKNIIFIFALILSITSAGTIFGQTSKNTVAKNYVVGKTPKQEKSLASHLPNSDAVINIDTKRLMNEAFPQILATKPQVLQEINSKLDEVKSKFGIDLKQFNQVAVGLGYKTISSKETDFEPVILARGDFKASAFLGVAKLAAKGKYREEKIGEKTVYIFSPKEVLEQHQTQNKDSFIGKMIDSAMKSFTKEVALTSYDENTLVIGSIARVKETFESKTRVDEIALNLANKNPNAIISFGANMPAGVAQFLPIDNDELGANIESIKQVNGALDMADGKMTLLAAAKTTDAASAEGLEETLSGLQMVGKAILGGSSRADQQLYARLLENAVIARQDTEVSLNLSVPQGDIDALMAILVKN